MKIDVSGKTVLVTGASRGIGRAIAEAFAAEGSVVYGTGRSLESISWMKDSHIRGRTADVSRPGEVGKVIDEIVSTHGKLDCLVNNAGVSSSTPASAFKEDEMNMIIDTNFKGVFRACQAYYKAQKKHGGTIINLASVLGLVGTPLASVYCGTKGAVVQLTRALAIEWVGSNFRVNAVCPGFIDTDMTIAIKDKPAVLEKAVSVIPMKRLGRPEEIAGAAIFLASDAASYMTGQLIVVDGGMTAM